MLESKNEVARTWLDAFPWLEATANPADGWWWHRPIAETGEAQTRRNLMDISEIAISQLSRWTVGQLLPTLPTDVRLEDLGLSVRAHNAFARADVRVTERLTGWSLEEILDLRNVGAGTVADILVSLAEVAARNDAAVQPSTRREQNDATVEISVSDTPVSTTTPDSAGADMAVVAEWFALIGLPDAPVLSAPLARATPENVVKARQRLNDLTSAEILSAASAPDAADVLGEVLAVLDDRAVEILVDRMFADHPKTLHTIGTQFGVTRERVRQIESAARSVLLEEMQSHSGNLSWLAEATRCTVRSLLPLDVLLAEIPSLTKPVERVGQPAWRVLDRLDDSYEIEDGWCAAPTVDSAKSETAAQLEELADHYGVARIDSLVMIAVDSEDLRVAFTEQWLEHCGYRLDGSFVYTRTQSVQDYAASILSTGGVPLSSDDINARFLVDRSVRSLRNALAKDERFSRVDRDSWALSEWGMDTYSGIRSVIRDEVSTARGSVHIDALVEKVTSKYSVSASSVIAYATGAPFETVNGMVQLAARTRVVRKLPRQTRRMFRRPRAWVYRVTLTRDHLRGSGSPAPIALATVVHLQPRQSVQLASRLGDQTVAWSGLQPVFGTIRRFLLALDAAVGNDVFLVMNDDRTFSVELARELCGDAMTDALALVGAKESSSSIEAYEALCAAIEASPGSGVASLIGAFRNRGDIDIADLLLEGRMLLEGAQTESKPSVFDADVDDILELL